MGLLSWLRARFRKPPSPPPPPERPVVWHALRVNRDSYCGKPWDTFPGAEVGDARINCQPCLLLIAAEEREIEVQTRRKNLRVVGGDR